jgi:NADH dehydrogenase/NADH:ubiquinone oxidoreductase subunit G
MQFSIILDNVKIMIKPFQKTLYQVLNYLYFNIPHFCYNKQLFIAGNCRMCLVEIVNVPKPIVSCSVPLTPNSIILTKSAFALKSRENILEFILLNHPIDCAICDQGGECDLQEYSQGFGQGVSRFFFFKKYNSYKNLNSLVVTSMNRCINCTKCTRLSYKLGLNTLSLLGRSLKSEIYNFGFIFQKKRKFKTHELFSNVIDICPVSLNVI